ncbi:MAG: glycosyltransferase family 2 protein [Candidatus Hodarchaeales archaeon]
MAAGLFFLTLALLVYVYVGYPLILFTKHGSSDSLSLGDDAFSPFVSVIIPAHNEERCIAKKISNALAQIYRRERLEVLLTSDGSSDKTVQIAKSFGDSRIKVIENQERQGKNAAINAAISSAEGDILVFTDANAIFVEDAIHKLVNYFQDPNVGLVCGHLKYLNNTGYNVERGEGLYFKYESLLKGLESRWGSVAVVTGSIYAIRRSLSSPLDLDVANDFAHPVQVGNKGYKIVFEPGAIAYERTTSSVYEEFKRRSRIVTRGFTAFGRYWKPYSMLRGIRGFCFISHKLLRWFTPFFLLSLLITNLFLTTTIFKITLYIQVAFYIAAFCGVFIKGKRGKLLVVPFYFCMINLAALVGFINYLRGKKQAVWDVATTTR